MGMKLPKDVEDQVLKLADPCTPKQRASVEKTKQQRSAYGSSPKAVPYGGNEILRARCLAVGLAEPQIEYPFAPWAGGKRTCPHDGVYACKKCGAHRRKWCFDYLWEGEVALEVEGGAFSQGRHVRGEGYVNDMEKYNAAQILGFLVLRCTPQQFESGEGFALVRRALGLDCPHGLREQHCPDCRVDTTVIDDGGEDE